MNYLKVNILAMTEPNLVNDAISFGRRTSDPLPYLLTQIITAVLFPIIDIYFLMQGQTFCYLLSGFASFVIYIYYTTPYQNDISLHVTNLFIHESYERYDSLSFETKNKSPMKVFYRIMTDAAHVIGLMFTTGVPDVLRMIGTVASTCVVFYVNNIYKQAFICAIIVGAIYIICVIPQQRVYNTDASTRRKKKKALLEKIDMNLAAFQHKERSVDYMYGLYGQIVSMSTDDLNQRLELTTNLKWVIKICIIVVAYRALTAQGFILTIMSLKKLEVSFDKISKFSNWYNRMCDEYTTYTDFFKSAVYAKSPIPIHPCPDLKIVDVNITRGDFKLTSSIPINFYKGVKILIRGTSGGGKSTLMNAITGKIKGVTFNYGSSSSYYGYTVDMYQDIREQVPSSRVTVRDYFQDEPKDSKISEYIKLVFSDKEYKDWTDLLGDKGTNPYDVHMNNRISGGQKTRLLLATRAYEYDKYGKDIIILDEPEQGSDPDTIVDVMNKFCKRYDDATIIVVSHMCECQLKRLHIKWNHKLMLTGGKILQG
jgi:ABC-type Mn2+/Zn2+ transport system ATPase subunit